MSVYDDWADRYFMLAGRWESLAVQYMRRFDLAEANRCLKMGENCEAKGVRALAEKLGIVGPR